MSIDKEKALKIVKKLKAELSPKANRPHDLFIVSESGVKVSAISIRRGSNKSAGHGHVPGNLLVTQSEALDLANCPMSREQYLQRLRDKGKL